MKKGFGWLAGLAVLAVMLGATAQAQKPHKGHEALCPMHIEGAQVQVTDTDGGVTISITAKDPAAVKEIQAAAAAHAALKKAGCPCCAGKTGKAAQAVYACPMKGCYKGPNTKDGRCPHCGMNLQKL